MWAYLALWFTASALALTLAWHAGYSALHAPTARRRADAYRVFKLVWGPVVLLVAGAGLAGAVKLHQTGLL